MQKTDEEFEPKKIPIWGMVAIVSITTIVAFWLSGGQHYVLNHSEIHQAIFHQQEDAASPVVWFFYFLQTGLLAGFVALLLSLSTVILFNRKK